VRPFSTIATSNRLPVRILSEFSLKRPFQLATCSIFPSPSREKILRTSDERITGRKPTPSAFC
jgi:hypothetical protein